MGFIENKRSRQPPLLFHGTIQALWLIGVRLLDGLIERLVLKVFELPPEPIQFEDVRVFSRQHIGHSRQEVDLFRCSLGTSGVVAALQPRLL